jgi:hypothetical protein
MKLRGMSIVPRRSRGSSEERFMAAAKRRQERLPPAPCLDQPAALNPLRAAWGLPGPLCLVGHIGNNEATGIWAAFTILVCMHK